MKKIEWNEEKNTFLKKERNISFEDIVVVIESGAVLDIIKHTNTSKYSNQKIYVVYFDNYVYLVPFVEDDKKIFLKTVIPSRKYIKIYLYE